jgi:hypothetical protein
MNLSGLGEEICFLLLIVDTRDPVQSELSFFVTSHEAANNPLGRAFVAFA